jgi:hypothetical protein
MRLNSSVRYLTVSSSPFVPGPRPSYSSDESVLMWRIMSSALTESSAGFSSAGSPAACAGVGVVAAAFWLVGVVVVHAPVSESSAASAEMAMWRLFILCMASLWKLKWERPRVSPLGRGEVNLRGASPRASGRSTVTSAAA